MIFAMLFCMENKLQFVMTDKNANFASYSNAPWEEFFEPFCVINRDKIHARYNQRNKITRKNKKLKIALYKLLHGVKYFTQDIFYKVYPDYYDKEIILDKLDIKGNTFEVIKPFAEMVWTFKPSIKEKMQNVLKEMHLPSKYAAIQMRRGDKVTIWGTITASAQQYMEELKKLTDIKDVLLLCDDYDDVKYLMDNYPEYRFYTICKPDEHGYCNDTFQALEPEKKKERFIELFATVDAMLRADLFLGTSIANPQLFLKMIMPPEKFFLMEKLVPDSLKSEAKK